MPAVEERVRLVVWMTLRAMRLSHLPVDSSAKVNAVRYLLKVVWVNTGMVATQMVGNETCRGLTGEEVVGKYVNAVDVESSVALSVDCSEPQHAAVGATRINLRPEALCRRTSSSIAESQEGIAVSPPALPVFVAPASLNSGCFTAFNGANSRTNREKAPSDRIVGHREFDLSGVMARDVSASPCLSILAEGAF